MDAFFIYKNDIHQLAAELKPAALMSFSLDWIGNTKKRIWVDLTRVDDLGTHRWKPVRLLVGDKISFITTDANNYDEPIESLTAEALDHLQRSKPKMKPAKRARPRARNIGELYCQINNKDVFSFHLSTGNLLSIAFVWIGDRNGTSMIHIGLDGSSPQVKIPKIKFGDEVTFGSRVHG